MSALGRVVRSGVGRRRVQTVVIGMVVMIAVTSAVLGWSLMLASSAPFDRAFEQQKGAHLTVQFDPARATAAQLSASAQADGVTAVAGPFRTVSISPVNDRDRPSRPLTVVGRSEPGGPVDAVTLTGGRWVTGPGEIVLLDRGPQRQGGPGMRVGGVLRLPDLPGSPALTVVGTARSVSETAGGWVSPEQVTALTPPGTAGAYQMLYRVASADTTAQVDAARAAVEATVPAGALTGTRSWLTTRTDKTGQTVLFVPFLIAFGALGVLMAILIITNVIAGAVSTGTHRIGILKALGFTPHQVVRAYTVQALIPAVVGAVLGIVVGNVLTVPVLRQTNELYGTNDSGVALWLDVAVLAGALALVTVTAWAAASRAGRLRTVDVLAVGRTPGPGRGHWAARLSGRLPLPRPATLGLAQPFAHPVRSATIVAAIAFGVAAATFAVGLAASLGNVEATESPADVLVVPGAPMSGPAGGGPRTGPGPAGPDPGSGPPPAPDPAAVHQAITAQAGTSGYSGIVEREVTVAGLTAPVDTRAFTGDNSGYGYKMISGTWFTGPGEIVVARPFLAATRTQVGDTVVLTDSGTRISARIVGEVFNIESRGMQILTAVATLAVADPELRAETYHIVLKPGTDPDGYSQALTTALTGMGAFALPADEGPDELLLLINALATLLTLLLTVVAALGVLNMVVLGTRERVHDLGVHKALGMTPRQTIAMVLASVVVTGLIGGAIGVPVGVLLQRLVVGEMGRSVGFHLPDSVTDIYRPDQLVLFGLGGLLIAAVGALLPAGWAARTRTANALRTE